MRAMTGGAVSANQDIAAVLSTLRPRDQETGLIGGDPALCARVLGVDGIAVSLTTSTGLVELVWYASKVSARLGGSAAGDVRLRSGR